jgi:hypothetical protein
VQLKSINLTILPFGLPFDIDGDGQAEYFELYNTRLDSSFFDLERSRGSLDLATGEFTLDFAYRIDLEQFRLPKSPDQEQVGFVVRERGTMDVKTGIYSFWSGALEVQEGPLTGMVVVGGDVDDDPPTRPVSTISLSVYVMGPSVRSCQEQKQDRVWICENDQVLLCWESSADVISVDIDPGGYTGLPANGQMVVSPSLPPGVPAATIAKVIYRARTNGGHTPGTEDTVDVQFYRGERIPQNARPDGRAAWVAELSPHSMSGRIRVWDYGIERRPGCIEWNRYQLEHYNAAGAFDYGDTINTPAVNVPPHRRFPAAGRWVFLTLIDPGTTSQQPSAEGSTTPICFWFRGACSS